MIKFWWYIFSVLTIILILISSPNSGSLNSFISQSKILNFSSNQTLTQKLISFNVFMFFILTILYLVY